MGLLGEEDDNANIGGEGGDDVGLKVIDGIGKIIGFEGGPIVLTLKDQALLASDVGEINQETDTLESVEIGEQKRRDEAYRSGKRKNMVFQYDDDEFVVEEEERLGVGVGCFEDLNSSGKLVGSDYYTNEEILAQCRKPGKKKSLRKKDRLDINALEAEAISLGLGAGDQGNRKRKALMRDEQERMEAEKRSNAFQSAYAKADQASKALRMEPTITAIQVEEVDNTIIDDDYWDHQNSLQRAKNLSSKRQIEGKIALLASLEVKNANGNNRLLKENKVVFTEMEEFTWGHKLMEDADQEQNFEEVKDTVQDEIRAPNQEEKVKPEEIIHEKPIGKGLSGVLNLLKERGNLKDTIEWAGRNMDQKKRQRAQLGNENDPEKEIFIERTDKYGRNLTEKEAFRQFSHKFHGKGPGKMKQEKHIRQYQEELKVKQTKTTDSPSLSLERMREALYKLQKPCIVLSGHANAK